jgi:hypothetical protein
VGRRLCRCFDYSREHVFRPLPKSNRCSCRRRSCWSYQRSTLRKSATFRAPENEWRTQWYDSGHRHRFRGTFDKDCAGSSGHAAHGRRCRDHHGHSRREARRPAGGVVRSIAGCRGGASATKGYILRPNYQRHEEPMSGLAGAKIGVFDLPRWSSLGQESTRARGVQGNPNHIPNFVRSADWQPQFWVRLESPAVQRLVAVRFANQRMGPVQSRAQPQPIVRHSEDAGVTKLRTLAPGWDGQDAPAPTPDAIARLERFLPGIRSVRGASATVTADVEGGASIFLRDRNHNPNEPSPNQATVFFGNDDPGLMVVSVFRPTRVTRCKEWPRADHEAEAELLQFLNDVFHEHQPQ